MVIYNTKDDPYLNVITGKNNAIKIGDVWDMLVGKVALFPGSVSSYYLKRNLTAGYIPNNLDEVIFLFQLWDKTFQTSGDKKDEAEEKQTMILYIILMLVLRDKNAMFKKLKPAKPKASTSQATAPVVSTGATAPVVSTGNESLDVIKYLVENIKTALEERCDPSNDITSYKISSSGFGVFTGLKPTSMNNSQLNVFNSIFTAALKLIDNYVRMPYLINDFLETLKANASWMNQFSSFSSETDMTIRNFGKVSFLCNAIMDKIKIEGFVDSAASYSVYGAFAAKQEDLEDTIINEPILNFAKVGVKIYDIKEPFLQRMQFPVLMVRVPFYIWYYLSDYMNANFLGDTYSKIWISSTREKAKNYLSGELSELALLGDTKIFAETKKKFDEIKREWDSQDSDLYDDYLNATQKNFDYYEKNYYDSQESIPTGLFVMTFRTKIVNSKNEMENKKCCMIY